MSFVLSADGGSYYTYDEWQHWTQNSYKQVNKLLEAYGNKCQQRGVCESVSRNFSKQNT